MKKTIKKKKGELPSYIIVILLGILSFFAIITSAMGGIEAADKYLTANRIARKYMLKVESYGHGYLNQDDASRLREDLETQGFKNVDLSGSTMTKVDNGADIYLNIKYDQTIRKLKIQNINIKIVNEIQRVEIPLSSTAKN